MNVITIASAKTADLVKFYNDFAERIALTPVKKFADRATAEKRVADFVAKLAGADADFIDLAEGHIPAPEGFEGEIFQSIQGEIQREGATDEKEPESTPEDSATDTVESTEGAAG